MAKQRLEWIMFVHNNKMKKIKLLTAPYKFYNQFMPPVALGIISQTLFDNNIDHDKDDLYVKLHYHQKKGHINLDLTEEDIKRWDGYIKGEDNEDVERVVSKIASLTNFEGYDVLLFSANPPAFSEIPNNILPLALFRFLKKKYNPIIITNNNFRGKDLGIVDEVIRSVPYLFEYLREKLDLDINPDFKMSTKQNLDGLPLDLYSYQGVMVAGYYFYDGCPFNCYFCGRFFAQKSKDKKGISLPDTKKIVDEIKEFADKYGIRNFMFLNTTINPTEKFARDLANNIIEAGLDIKWCDCANFRGISCELLDLLKKAGCVKLVFGLETASKRLQKRINKDLDLAHVENIIKHCRKIGILVDVTLLCGLPYETYYDIYETLLFIRKNYRYLRGLNLNRYSMAENSEFRINAKKHGLIVKIVDNGYTYLGFDEVNGMKWEEKWSYTEGVYQDVIKNVDSVRVDFLKPVQPIFKAFSNNQNSYYNLLDNDTSKLGLLIEKYKNLVLGDKKERHLIKTDKLKIQLVMPPRCFLDEAKGMISIPPLGMAHLAAFLKNKGQDVELDDLDIKVISDKKLFERLLELQENYSKDELEDYLQGNKTNPYLDEITDLLLEKSDFKGYNIVGFSIIESSATDSTLLISKKIKEETGAIILLGGDGANPELKEKYNFVDDVIVGQGEEKFLDIIDKIQGKSSIEAGKLSDVFPKPKPDFSGLPLSCYRNTPEENGFYNPGKILILPYLWSMWCPYNCSFCGYSLGKRKPILKPVSQTIKELKEISSEYNTKYFFVLNQYIHIDKEHTIGLCNDLIKQKLDILWCGCMRCNIDPKILPLLSKAGFFYATFGMESASDKILKSMRKGYNSETAENTVKAAHNAGMWVALYIIVSFPHETEEDFKKTFDFVNRNIDYIDQLNVCSFRLNNSAILRNPEEFGIKIRGSIGVEKNDKRLLYAYDEVNGYSWEEIERLKNERLYKLYKLFYMHKGVSESFLRASTYQLFYAFDKFRDKKKVFDFIKKRYSSEKGKFVLNVTSLSNDNCLFCEKPKEAFETLEEINKKIMDLKKKGVKKIVISGGEPTIISSIFDIIKELVKEGFEIKLRTNARMLHYRDFCEKLQNAGLEVISVPLYSHKPDKHDAITRVKGSFNQTIGGIDNWKQIGGDVEIEAMASEYNKEDIYEFVDFILDKETTQVF